MIIVLVIVVGVYLKFDKRFNLVGDIIFRVIFNIVIVDEMMVLYGGYDNGDVNKDINCMFFIDRLYELVVEGFIKGVVFMYYVFMGGGGN